MTRSTGSAEPRRTNHRSTVASGALRGRASGSKASGGGRRSTAPRTTPAKPRQRKSTVPPPFIPGPAKRGRRLAPAYDLEGPKVRMGVLWCIVVFGALALGRLAFDVPLVCLVFSAAAAIAAIQVVDAWEAAGPGPTRVVAGVGAASIGASSMFGARALGAAILVFAAVTLLVGVAEATRRRPMLATTALLLQASLPVGLVAASVQLVTRYEIGAVVILLAVGMGFDLGDYLIGSGAGSLIEGPMAGGLVVVLVVAVAAIIQAPPFDGSLVWVFGVAALALCPLGQVVASWLLPDATTRAGALRRLDSLLVLAPAWAIAAGIVSARS